MYPPPVTRSLGHRVRIVEASQRTGGRVRTHLFSDGTYDELGAMRIADYHDYARHYVKLLRLTLRPFVSAYQNLRAYYDIRGVRVRMPTAPTYLYPHYCLSQEQLNDPIPP